MFVDEQGVEPAADRDGRDPEALHLVALEDGAWSAPAACSWTRASLGSGGWPSSPGCAARGLGAALLGRGRARLARAAGTRRIACTRRSTPRGALRARRLRGRRRGVPRRGHRARDDGEAPLPELRIDPLSGLRVIVAGERGDAARRVARRRRAAGGRPRDRPVPRGPRGPHAAGGLRPAARRRRAGLAGLARAGGAEPLPRARARASGDEDGDPLAPAAASPTCSPRGPPRGAHEVVVNGPEPVGSLLDLGPGRTGRGDGRLARADARARGRRLRAPDRERGPRGRGVAAAHPRPALRAAVRAGRGGARARALHRLLRPHPGPQPARRRRSRRRSSAASGSWRWTPRPWRICPFASRVPFHVQIVPRDPRPRFEDDGPLGAALLHDVLRAAGRRARRAAAVQPLGAHRAARRRDASAGGSTCCRAWRTSPGSSWAPA